MPYLYSPRAFAQSVQQIRGLADAAGRDLSRFEWMQYLFINAGDDPARAKAETAAYLGASYAQDFTPLVDKLAAAGAPEEVAARVQAFVDAGARHFIFVPTSADRIGMAKRILDDVLPRVAVPKT
jgi:alkanesulfonate monooxygenase SsuD/methylene tetrahydromethanopterin reductase-like flavin-dependent oxidoreductase (luciferase family)